MERQASEKLGLKDLLGLAWEKSRPYRFGFLLGIFVLSFSFFLIVAKVKSPALKFRAQLSPPQEVSGTQSAIEASSPGRSAKTNKINLNTATAQALAALPGIGPITAARIIEFRQKHGPFKKIADLDAVKGIGPKTIEKIRPFVIP